MTTGYYLDIVLHDTVAEVFSAEVLFTSEETNSQRQRDTEASSMQDGKGPSIWSGKRHQDLSLPSVFGHVVVNDFCS